jgi:trimeric autotransporter adhesin
MTTYHSIKLTNTLASARPLMSQSLFRRSLRLIALMFACLVFSASARAVTPAPDGGYPGSNTAEGDSALFSLTSGTENTAVGASALFKNTTGVDNTAVGVDALISNTSGHDNTALGLSALSSNINGNYNTAVGLDTLFNNTSGISNTAIGTDALQSNTTTSNNTAVGTAALTRNNGGADNTATGTSALFNNTNGSENTANGFQALYNNISGGDNTANGLDALLGNTTGGGNTANGVSALYSNSSGSFNTADGINALRGNNGSSNTAVGIQALNKNTTGSLNTAIGALAGENLTTGNNNIDIGANVLGNAGEANTIRIGKSGTQQKTFVAGIYGKTVASGVGVIINSSGQLGTVQSSARFKDDIKPMDKASEAILKLKPVTFRYKQELDPEGIPQFGLIAEEVEKVNPGLVARDEDGKVTSVRYETVNAMLLNEFLKAHRRLEAQERKAQGEETRLSQAEAIIAQQQKQIEALTAAVRN